MMHSYDLNHCTHQKETNQKIRTSVKPVLPLKIPQMGESPKKSPKRYLEKFLKNRNSEKPYHLSLPKVGLEQCCVLGSRYSVVYWGHADTCGRSPAKISILIYCQKQQQSHKTPTNPLSTNLQLPYLTLTGPHCCSISHSLGLTAALSHTHWASLLPYLTLTGPHCCSISHSLGLTTALSHTHWASLLPYLTLTGPHYCSISHSLGLTTALSHTHWASLLPYLTLTGPHYCPISHSLGLTTSVSHTHWASLLLYVTLTGPHYCSMSLSLAGALLFKYLQHIESVGVKEAKKKKAKLLATAAKVLHYTTHSLHLNHCATATGPRRTSQHCAAPQSPRTA